MGLEQLTKSFAIPALTGFDQTPLASLFTHYGAPFHKMPEVAPSDSCGRFLRQILPADSCGRFLRQILAADSCGRFLRQILAADSCGRFLWRIPRSISTHDHWTDRPRDFFHI